jgi:BirA family biotin operon repressor/biotin-[acetyl-CoA-carboxylase] ligase
VAEHQTQGRGKWGRQWSSPPGKNLLFSLLLYPRLKASHAPLLTQIACRSVAKVLERKFKLQPTFKRPNDVLIRGKKICGVLIEAQGRANGDLESLVIGIGLNVNASPEELVPGATSIREETGRKQARQALLGALLRQLARDLKNRV